MFLLNSLKSSLDHTANKSKKWNRVILQNKLEERPRIYGGCFRGALLTKIDREIDLLHYLAGCDTVTRSFSGGTSLNRQLIWRRAFIGNGVSNAETDRYFTGPFA